MYINQKSFLNMKQINKLLVILLALVTFSSCETYGDYEIEYTAIYPLCGEWVVNVTGEDGGVLAEGVTCNTYNTTDDATDKMWIKMSVATNDWGVRGKIHCDVTSKSFDGDGIANLLHADPTPSTSTQLCFSRCKPISPMSSDVLDSAVSIYRFLHSSSCAYSCVFQSAVSTSNQCTSN